MKILISYGFKKPYPPIGIFCYQAFKSLGHKVDIFNSRMESPFFKKVNKLSQKLDLKITKLNFKERINNLLILKTSRMRPNIILDIGGRFLYPQTLEKIKKIYSPKLALWATERARDAEDKDFFEEAIAYDYVFSTSNYAVRNLKLKGIKNIHYLPFATDVNFYKKFKLFQKDLNKYNCEVGFVGAYDENRERILKNLTDFDLKIWGTEWDRLSDEKLKCFVKGNSGLYDKNLVKFYNATKINLNITRERYNRHPSGMDLRVFDIPSCQAFLITQYVEEIMQTFELGKEIEVFNSCEELKDKIKFYLHNNKKRDEIIQKGYEKICKCHTFEKRMQEMLSLLKCKKI